jgi:hypothetical protein
MKEKQLRPTKVVGELPVKDSAKMVGGLQLKRKI